MEITPIFVLLILSGALYAILHLYVRKKERMALLEKGADASKLIFPKRISSSPLKYGLLLIGVAVGLLLGDILNVTTELQEEVARVSPLRLQEVWRPRVHRWSVAQRATLS